MMANIKYTPDKELSQKWAGLKNWKDYKENFSITGSDTAYKSLTKYYKDARDEYKKLAESAQYKNLLTETNNLVNGEKNYSLSLDKSVSEYLDKIQKINLWEWVSNSNGNNNSMLVSAFEGQELMDKINEIGKDFYGEKWEKANANLGLLKQLADNIEKQKTSSNNGSIELLQCFPSDDKSININNITAARKVQGAIKRLRGSHLEQEITKLLRKKMPYKIAVNTGGIKLGTKSIKEDIATFFTEFQILNEKNEVAYIFKEDGSIVDKDGTVVEKVVLTEYQYKELQDKMFMAVSAKSSSSTTVFHGGYNINTLLDEVKDNDKIVYQLIHAYQLGFGPSSNIIAYQKYAISKNLLKIIGKKNVFMASKTGIIPTYQYLDKLINGNKKSLLRFKNNKLPARNIGNSLNENFGTTDIIGSPIKNN